VLHSLNEMEALMHDILSALKLSWLCLLITEYHIIVLTHASISAASNVVTKVSKART
jgi:hypothetical protein